MSNYLTRDYEADVDEYYTRELERIVNRYELEQELIREACEDNLEFKKLHEQYEIMKTLLIGAALNGNG